MEVLLHREDEQTRIEAFLPQSHTKTHAYKRAPTYRSPDRLAAVAVRPLRHRAACTERRSHTSALVLLGGRQLGNQSPVRRSLPAGFQESRAGLGAAVHG